MHSGYHYNTTVVVVGVCGYCSLYLYLPRGEGMGDECDSNKTSQSENSVQ